MKRGFLIGGAFLLTSTAAQAQINAESFARLGFNFSPPGARSAALGGAFIPLADDATAAETNPAGLVHLLYPQISAELKSARRTRTIAPQAGGGPDGNEFTTTLAHPSFASFVVPVGDARFGAFRHELVNYRSQTWGGGYAGDGYTLLPYTSAIDLRVFNYGFSAAYKVMPGLFVGASGGLSLATIDVAFPRHRADFSEENIVNRLTVDDEASGTFVNAGVLLTVDQRISIGAVYKRRPSFETLSYQTFVARTSQTDFGSFALKVPDSYGAGLAYRHNDVLTLAFSGEMTRYSQLAAHIALPYQSSTGGTLEAADYAADDGLDLHAGGEYVVFVRSTPVALRAGVGRIAASNTYYTGEDQVEKDLWGSAAGKPQFQATAGAGLVLARRLQMDAAGVVDGDHFELVASLVLLLGR